MTAPKIVVAGATYALTRRCVLRKFLLSPFAPVVHQGITYCLAKAARVTGTTLHHVVVMPNHMHVTGTMSRSNLPVFKRLLYGETAKFIQAVLAEHDIEAPENVFAAGRSHHMRLVNDAAQLSYLHYQDINPIAAGLVERVQDYPGLISDLGLMLGAPLVVKRPALYFGRGQPDELEIPFCAPPQLERAFGSTREVVYHLRRARAQKERVLARRRAFPVLGARQLVKQHPWSEPRAPRNVEPGAVPTVHVVGDEALRARCEAETRSFRERHESARLARLTNERELFPYGTYAMRVFHRVEVESPSAVDERILTCPAELAIAVPWTKHQLSELLRTEASSVDEADFDDTLAQRLEEAREDTSDRQNATKTRLDPNGLATADAPEGEGVASPKKRRSKVVVTRDTVPGATERRRLKRAERRARSTESAGEVELLGDGGYPDPDPPPH